MFHLMTHAFFKALLFMAAGSVIAAMAGIQNLDRMGGFRRAMPFTFGCMVVGGLALSGVPPFSGFFSKDEIIALLFARDDWHIVLGVLGYVGSLLTAIYTFRMIFRAFYGEPCPEARELEHGHLYHAEQPTNPMTGEIEDTDVGFPGPEHHIAEREFPMKLAMGALAVLAIIGGIPQIPRRQRVAAQLPRADVRRLDALRGRSSRPTTLTDVGLLVGAADRRSPASSSRTRCGSRRPELPARLQARFAPLHRLLRQQVVLRRGDRPADRAAGDLARPLRQHHVRARVRGRRARRRHARASSGSRPPGCAACRPATCATTPRSCCWASRRSAPTS